jgi:hypothetical protein
MGRGSIANRARREASHAYELLYAGRYRISRGQPSHLAAAIAILGPTVAIERRTGLVADRALLRTISSRRSGPRRTAIRHLARDATRTNGRGRGPLVRRRGRRPAAVR